METKIAKMRADYSLDDLRLFRLVASLGSYTKAAEHSGIPLSTLSRRIAALESALTIRLLERNAHRLILTRADGDGRGGAALSMRHVTGLPIKFLGAGEKIDQLDVFDARRVAGLEVSAGMDRQWQGDALGQQQHGGRQPVGRQVDAERRAPAADDMR